MEAPVSKGFLIYAENLVGVDYIKQAYALALSIKRTQSKVTSVSLMTNDDEFPLEYRAVFDHIVPIPWYDAPGTEFSAEHRWKLIHATPYDETIVLDSDMLMLTDQSHWWDHCANYDFRFCGQVRNYKYDVITHDTYYRKAFINNGLSNPYCALHYFKKNEAAFEFFKVLEFVCKNWELCYGKFAPENYQDWLSMDLSVAIAIDMLGIAEQAVDNTGSLEFIHMKPALQNWLTNPPSWQDGIQWLYNRDFTIGNIKQVGLLHYIDKDFVTDSIIERLL
jgi:hypothetical protein